ncbi:MAG: hypothetical protein EP313_02780, partial [Bacteroidetes bacterium]
MKSLFIRLIIMLLAVGAFTIDCIAQTAGNNPDTLSLSAGEQQLQAASESTDSSLTSSGEVDAGKEKDGPALVYKCDIKKMIAAPLWRSVKKSFA